MGFSGKRVGSKERVGGMTTSKVSTHHGDYPHRKWEGCGRRDVPPPPFACSAARAAPAGAKSASASLTYTRAFVWHRREEFIWRIVTNRPTPPPQPYSRMLSIPLPISIRRWKGGETKEMKTAVLKKEGRERATEYGGGH